MAEFCAGEILAGRFRVLRMLASGGMGEVYEAEDRELNERIAVKTIRAENAGDPVTLARFKREIQLARKVTHPNVCRIFELFQAQRHGDHEVSFLTMELLEGQTLAERLRMGGPFRTEGALPVAEQLAAGLAAAHRAGVVHRDLKPSNIVLVPAAGGTRVVITDFGLARLERGDAPALLGEADRMVGTFEYMAPEQVEGKPVTAATDLYALGLVLFEMLTGVRPFHGETRDETAYARLGEPPPLLRRIVPEAPAAWEAVVRRCLEKDPADRFGDASEIPAALRGREPARRKRRRARAAILVAAAGLAAWAASSAIRGRAHRRAEEAAREARRPSVAVVEFRNLAKRSESDWLSMALAEMLSTELSAGQKLRALSGAEVARAKIDLSLGGAGLPREKLARLRERLGADYAVTGSYLTLEDGGDRPLRVDVRLHDAASGETIAALAERGSESSLFEMVSRMGTKLRERLGIRGVSALDSERVAAALPRNPEAARSYAKGLARLRLFDALGARRHFERALAAQPDNALCHSALAEAFSTLGYDEKARGEAARALELSGGLSREERLVVDAQFREANREWDKAVAVSRRLFLLFPDNPDYGLRLARDQIAAGDATGALSTVAELRAASLPGAPGPRVTLEEARAAQALSDYRRSASAAAASAGAARARGSLLLVAEARLVEAESAWHLGDPKKSSAACDEAARIFASAGDRAGAARALSQKAVVRADQGDLDSAKKEFLGILAEVRAIGDRSGEARTLNALANISDLQRDRTSSMATYREALAVYREIGRKDGVAMVLGNLGTLYDSLNDLPRAQSHYEQALALDRELGNQSGMTANLGNLGFSDFRQGDLAGAKSRFEEQLGLTARTGSQIDRSYALANLASVAGAEGDFALAKKFLGEELALSSRLGEENDLTEIRINLASLDFDEGRWSDAEAKARKLVAPPAAPSPDNLARASNLIARCLLRSNRLAEAQEWARRAESGAARSETDGVRFQVAVTSSRVAAGAGRIEEAEGGLARILAETSRKRFVPIELEAKLALGEIELASGRRTSGSALLAALTRDARRMGFVVVARKAEEVALRP